MPFLKFVKSFKLIFPVLKGTLKMTNFGAETVTNP